MKRRSKNRRYTHIDSSGMAWRFEGSRPISALADKVTDKVLRGYKKKIK